MKLLAKLLCSALFVAFVSCSGSSVPTVRDYTTGHSTHNVNPQSVIALCPPSQPKCVGGGGTGCGGCGGTVYGTQADCDSGYLYFSDGCEDDGTNLALYSGWQDWFTIADVALLKYNVDHYWSQHLACYLTGSTSTQVNSAISHDFNINHYKQAGDPPIGSAAQFAFTYTDPNAGNKTITYRIYHYGNYTYRFVNYDTYIVGTAFIRGLPNCP